MAKQHSHTISLDLEQSARSKATIKALSGALEDAGGSLQALDKTFKTLSEAGVDATQEYNDVLAKTTRELDKRLGKLEEERIALLTNTKISEEERKALLDNNVFEKKRLEAKKKMVALRTKIAQVEGKTADAESRTLSVYGKIVSMQERLNSLLGKESKLRQGLAKAMAGAKKISGVALKGIGGVVGAAAGMAGAVVSGAGAQADKERALASLKGADEETADKVFVATGADYSTIVAAINRLSSKFHGDALASAAIQEVKNPGFAAMLTATTAPVDTAQLASVIAQVKRASGAQDLSAAMAASQRSRAVTRGQVSQADYLSAYATLQGAGLDEERINAIISSVAKQGGDFVEAFNRTDLAKYVRGQQKAQIRGLQISRIDPTKPEEQSSAERVQETLNRVQLAKDKLLQKVMPVVADTLERVVGSPMFNRVMQGLVGFLESTLPLVEQLMRAAMPVLERLLPLALRILEPLANALVTIVDRLTPVLDWAAEKLEPAIDTLGEFIGWMVSGHMLDDISGAYRSLWEDTIKPAINSVLKFVFNPLFTLINSVIDALNGAELFGSKLLSNPISNVSLPQLAQGGVATVPSICGEAGPELVLPLNNPGRASNIVNNYTTTQTFNLTGAQSPLSLAQAVDSQRYIRHACRW